MAGGPWRAIQPGVLGRGHRVTGDPRSIATSTEDKRAWGAGCGAAVKVAEPTLCACVLAAPGETVKHVGRSAADRRHDITVRIEPDDKMKRDGPQISSS